MISQIDITGIHYELNDDIKKYVTKKVGKLDRFVPRHARKSLHAEVKLSELKTKSNRNKCEIILHLPEQQLQATESTVNMFAAVDVVETKIKNQLKKYKGTHGGDKRDHRGTLRRLFRNQRNSQTLSVILITSQLTKALSVWLFGVQQYRTNFQNFTRGYKTYMKKNMLTKVFGDPQAKTVKRLKKRVADINELESVYEKMTLPQLKKQALEFRKQLKDKKTPDNILPHAFAVVRETAKRTLGMRHFDVQLIGGMTLHEGNVAEMKTGEGKTLVATLPVYLNALPEKGVHVITVNDYLAQRDVGWPKCMMPSA